MRFLLGAVLGGLVVIFAVQNTQAVTYSLFGASASLPKALVMIGSLVIGVIIGSFFGGGSSRRRR
jgi:uncharacterized integral membrane protein